jgi:hypothetical protein
MAQSPFFTVKNPAKKDNKSTDKVDRLKPTEKPKQYKFRFGSKNTFSDIL